MFCRSSRAAICCCPSVTNQAELFEEELVPDQGAAYSTIRDMPERYENETVNRSLHFTDSEAGVCTNKNTMRCTTFGHK